MKAKNVGRIRLFLAMMACSGLLFFGMSAGQARADGTETLGPPDIVIAEGTGVVAAGTGLIETQMGTIDVFVPEGATVNQVLLYWEGQMAEDKPGPDAISVNGSPVNGTLIGGQTLFFSGAYSSSYRADITSLGLVSPGGNTLSVGFSGEGFTKASNGAGVLVIFDDGSTSPAVIDLRDGLDLAFINFPEPLKSTVPQTFLFMPQDFDRTATLDMFFSSVQGVVSGQGDPRPTAVDILVLDELGTADFEDFDLKGEPFVNAGNQVVSNGFSFTSNGDIFVIGDPTACGGGCADNGTQTSVSLDIDGSNAGGPLTVSTVDGSTFGIAALDAAEGIVSNPSFPQATSITIEGTLEGGGTVIETFDLDGIIDGVGGEADFQTFMTGELAQAVLTQAIISAAGPSPEGDGAFSLDNIVFAAPGTLTTVVNELNSNDGEEWDTLTVEEIEIPAGALGLIVQAFSRDDLNTGQLPASFAWVAATLAVPSPGECVGKIGDYVWRDDGDGCQDPTPIAGVKVCLYEIVDCENPVADPKEVCTTTNEKGFYLFENLECGKEYEIEFVTPDGFEPTEPNQECTDDPIPGPSDQNDSDCVEGRRVCVSLGEETNVSDRTIDCGYVPECDIEVIKTCEVIADEPADGDVCEVLGKPVALTFEYIPGTDVNTGQDPGKAEILVDNGIDGDGVSYVIVTDENDAGKALAGDGKRFFQGNVAIGATFEANEDTDDFGSQTYIHFFDDASGGLLQSITYHTSCSQPIELGDIVGNATLVKYQGEIGSASAAPPEPGADACTIQSQIADCESIKALTGDDPEILTFRVTGGDCSASDNDQEPGKAECDGGFIDPTKAVEVSVNGDPRFTLQPGETFDVERGGDPEIEVFQDQDNAYQFNKFHASCSQPLQAGDRYGANELVALDGIGIGAEVRYVYEVKNNNEFETITDIAVVDNPLATSGVPGSPIEFLGPGISETLELTTFISETTVNTVTVNGKVDGAPICEAIDSVTVTVLPPPPCEVSAVFEKLEDDKLKYKLTNVGNRKATLDTFVVNFPAEYGLIKEVKLDGGIWKKGDSNDYPNGLPSGITIGSDTDWTEADVTKRQLDIGETRTLEVVFTAKSEGGGWVDIMSAGTAAFEEGCAVELISPSGCALGKPTELVFKYTGDLCEATTNPQEGSFECGETDPLGDLVSVEMTKDADKFVVAVDVAGNEVTIAYDDPAGEKFPSEIQYKITDSNGETQSHTLHTSCSKALSEGDQFGALILEVFVSEY